MPSALPSVTLTKPNSVAPPRPTASINTAAPLPLATPTAHAAGKPTATVQVAMQTLRVPARFDYAMARQVVVRIQAYNPNGAAYGRVPVEIFADSEHTHKLAIGITDPQGLFVTSLQLPATQNHLSVRLAALGVPHAQMVPVQGNLLELVLGVKK
jgi:hypothetical protein